MKKLLIGLALLTSMSAFAISKKMANDCKPTAAQNISSEKSFSRLEGFITTQQRYDKMFEEIDLIAKSSKDCPEYSALSVQYLSDLADSYELLKGYGI